MEPMVLSVQSVPFPALISRAAMDGTPNQITLIVNDAFTRVLGYTLDDVPDKNHWWNLAYPDPDYQKVVERQWELECETAQVNKLEHVSMDVLITNKYGQEKRFSVFSAPLPDSDDCYMVIFIQNAGQ